MFLFVFLISTRFRKILGLKFDKDTKKDTFLRGRMTFLMTNFTRGDLTTGFGNAVVIAVVLSFD